MKTRKQKNLSAFSFSPTRCAHAFVHFNEQFLESSALAYLDSQGSYLLDVGSCVYATVTPGVKVPLRSQAQCHWITCCKLEMHSKKKKVTFTIYLERERRKMSRICTSTHMGCKRCLSHPCFASYLVSRPGAEGTGKSVASSAGASLLNPVTTWPHMPLLFLSNLF